MTGLAHIAAATLALLTAHFAWGAGVDCATAHVRYFASSLLDDIMIEPRAVAVVKRVAPQALAPFGGATLPSGFGRNSPRCSSAASRGQFVAPTAGALVFDDSSCGTESPRVRHPLRRTNKPIRITT